MKKCKKIIKKILGALLLLAVCAVFIGVNVPKYGLMVSVLGFLATLLLMIVAFIGVLFLFD